MPVMLRFYDYLKLLHTAMTNKLRINVLIVKQDYERLSTSLKQRNISFSSWIRKKMRQELTGRIESWEEEL